ncbi:protein kinase domain protein [Ichthyophthirius multifiliis]|uniref:Protein kinase domain protein n=1 Tax=Ichthyophthirius multifiliis TaxID=5932 RepID=G0QXW4_ICHMU|nr:protein kinase domain protein [Ichthyophthirius multifiliis]EGR29941.1 protein kinase domain protein [Ichthyophthirius multifiliis]|eukprot:XP_004031177.1 protein kinase domain protein [Ichthyophthirius multifiliis]
MFQEIFQVVFQIYQNTEQYIEIQNLRIYQYKLIKMMQNKKYLIKQHINNKPQVSIYKLADFGFARTVDNFRRQMLDSLVGTPLYMSPQILMYEKYTSKSDIWSIGLIFYEMLYGCTPWGVTNQYQLLKDIKNIPVQFQVNGIVNISQEAINFIYKCLQIEENSRISWDEIYRHNLFGNYFSKFLQKTYQLENKAMYLINNLRQKIHKTNTDLMELFQNFELTEDSKLNMKSFESLMRQIDPQLTREEIEYIFNKFDGDEDNKIDFNEFTKWLKNNNIRMSTHENAQQKRKDLQKFQDLNLQIQLQEEEEKRNFQKRLAVYVDYYKVDIKLLFNKFNNSQDENKKLCYQDFKYLVQKTAEFLSDEIISQVFKKFDKDRDSFICFNEFKETMKELILKVQSNPNISQF